MEKAEEMSCIFYNDNTASCQKTERECPVRGVVPPQGCSVTNAIAMKADVRACPFLVKLGDDVLCSLRDDPGFSEKACDYLWPLRKWEGCNRFVAMKHGEKVTVPVRPEDMKGLESATQKGKPGTLADRVLGVDPGGDIGSHSSFSNARPREDKNDVTRNLRSLMGKAVNTVRGGGSDAVDVLTYAIDAACQGADEMTAKIEDRDKMIEGLQERLAHRGKAVHTLTGVLADREKELEGAMKQLMNLNDLVNRLQRGDPDEQPTDLGATKMRQDERNPRQGVHVFCENYMAGFCKILKGIAKNESAECIKPNDHETCPVKPPNLYKKCPFYHPSDGTWCSAREDGGNCLGCPDYRVCKHYQKKCESSVGDDPPF